MSDDKSKDEIIQYAKKYGVELTAGAIALITGDTSAAVPGLLLGSAISALHVDFSQRHLSPREKDRVGKTLVVAANKFQTNLDAGKPIVEYEEKTAEEIVEALLAAAQREHEDRKIIYIGNLLGNLGFHPEVNPMNANLLVNTAESLTYSQLVLLYVFSEPTLKSQMLQKDYRGKTNIPWAIIAYLQEIKELFSNGLIGMPGDTMLGLTDVNPGKMKTQGQGKMLVQLMELDGIPQADIFMVVSALSREVT